MKILVGYDNSNVSRAALQIGLQHARAFKAELIVVSSMDKGTEEDQQSIQNTEKELESICEEMKREGVECESHLLIRGMLPGEDIVGYAQDNDVDEIVIGIQRRSKVGKMLFGSTAQYVILKAHCPVVSVK